MVKYQNVLNGEKTLHAIKTFHNKYNHLLVFLFSELSSRIDCLCVYLQYSAFYIWSTSIGSTWQHMDITLIYAIVVMSCNKVIYTIKWNHNFDTKIFIIILIYVIKFKIHLIFITCGPTSTNLRILITLGISVINSILSWDLSS